MAQINNIRTVSVPSIGKLPLAEKPGTFTPSGFKREHKGGRLPEDGGFTASQDYRLMEGLALGYGLSAVAASVGVSPNAAADRFRALRAGMMDIHKRLTLEAHEALVRALRSRLN